MLKLDKSTWRRVKLGEVVKSSKGRVDPTSGEIDRYIAGEHMDSDDLRIHRWGEVGDKDLGPAFHRRFHPGQVLYGSRRTYLRKVSVAEFNGVCANTTFVLETSDKDALLQEFLPFVMTSEPFHAYAIAESKGSVNPYVNWSDIAKFEFGLPPLDEQKRIADLLWAVERHGRGLTAQLATLTDSSAAVFSQLLTRSVTKSIRLGKIGKFTRGRRFTKADYVDSGLGCIHYAQVHTDFHIAATEPLTYVPAKMESSLRLAGWGDLIIAGTSEDVEGVGKAITWLGADVAVHDDCFIYSHSLDPMFASYLFSSAEFNRAKRAYISESKVVRISSANLARMELPIPEIEEQQRIVREMAKIEKSADTIRHELQTTKSVRESLLSSIFGES